jgi:hypothetical protein
MGLAERRVIQDFQTNEMPKLQAAIDEAAGYAVPVDVHWEGLATDGESHLYEKSWRDVYFEPLITALQSITRDEVGQQALKTGLKKIVIQNTSGNYYADGFATFADGTLTLDHLPTTNAGDVEARAGRVVSVLEGAL